MNRRKQYDYLIVGAGIFGCTFAYKAHHAGKRCLVIDKRQHLGGNIYCEKQEGINVHKYGAHIFHTSNKEVWKLVNDIVPFNRYTNSPLANYKGQLYNLPFNMNTFHQMWGVTTPEAAMHIIDEQRQEARQRFKEPQNLEQQALVLVGHDIYERLIKGYTEKQWGRPCSELPSFIIRRLPVRLTFDNNYFNDDFQGIPIGGYNKLIDGLLEGVETRTNADFMADRPYWEGISEKILFTGRIDEYFDYCLGQLDYRSTSFETEIYDTPNYQGNAVVNYTDASVPYTRVIEHKHFELFGQHVNDIPCTVVSREYSSEWHPGLEPCYPINDTRNTELAKKYRDMAQSCPNIIFGGRLAEYKYYDMAPAIEQAMKLCNNPIVT